MHKLLKIDTSTRKSGSHSKDLANHFEKKWKAKHIETKVIRRNLTTSDIPHLSQSFIEAMFTPNEIRNEKMTGILSFSAKLIAELKSADTILLSIPMYNFSIPSVLKAYIDHITRVGETFSMGETASYGAEFSGMKAMDFVEPYLKSIFDFFGFY